MILDNLSITLEISALIVFAFFVIALIVFIVVKICAKKKTNYLISTIDIGISPCITLSLDTSDKQILYKIWVDINTRTLTSKIDLEVDNIKLINDSYHKCFIATRELIKEMPIQKLEKDDKFIQLLIGFLNNLLRPYLSKWGAYYSEWYNIMQEDNTKRGKYESFIEIQRRFPKYNDLTRDLLKANKRIINFSNELSTIVFNKNK